MKLQQINNAEKAQAAELFLSCCTSEVWVDRMVSNRPYANSGSVLDAAVENWQNLNETDYLQAFDGHPRIGDPNSLKEKYAKTKKLASGEQSSVQQASSEVINELAELNQQYYKKFGFIFIVFATGKSAEEMLALIKDRINNKRTAEIENAAVEQQKILLLRLSNFLNLVKAEPLTAEAFKLYGDVIDVDSAKKTFDINYGNTVRYHDLANIDTAQHNGIPIVSIFHSQPMPANFKISVMERHPLSSQAFFPLEGQTYIVIVAPAGEFDPKSLKAFIARADQGVNYARGVWHHYCQSIGQDSKFLVIDRKGDGDNCDEYYFEKSSQYEVLI